MRLKEVIKKNGAYKTVSFTKRVKNRDAIISYFKIGNHRIISKVIIPVVSYVKARKGNAGYLWLDDVEVKDIRDIFPKVGIHPTTGREWSYTTEENIGEEFARGVGRLINITSRKFEGLNQLKFWELGDRILVKNSNAGIYFITDTSRTILARYRGETHQIGDLNTLFRLCKDMILDKTKAVFIPSSPKNREFFLADRKSVKDGKIPMMFGKRNKLFFKREVLKGSDYFHKNFGEFPTNIRTFCVVKYAAGKVNASPLGLGFGDIVAVDDKNYRYFEVTKLRAKFKQSKDGIVLSKRSFVNKKTGQSRMIWYNTLSFEDGIIGYNGESPVKLPYIHKNLSVAFVYGRHTITYLYRKVGPSVGDKLQISIKGTVRDVVSRSTVPKEIGE